MACATHAALRSSALHEKGIRKMPKKKPTTLVDEFLSRQRLLVLAPHSDDETIGAGGLIARVKAAGGSAFVIVFNVGDLYHFNNSSTPIKGETRVDELRQAMKVLRVDDFEVLFHDPALVMRMDSLPRIELVQRIERTSRLSTQNIRPTMIVLPAPSFNQDHVAVYEAGITACRPHHPDMKSFQNLVLVADAPQLTWGRVSFHPNFYVDISDVLELKLKAYRCHRSQVRPSPHQGGIDALRLLAETRGREISVNAAEAFECLRLVI